MTAATTGLTITTYPPTMTTEACLIPYEAVNILVRGAALVLAPHPDDEVLGCGGAIMRHVAAGEPVTVIVVTDGAAGDGSQPVADYVRHRQQESQQAAEILGYGQPLFWDLPDRQLAYGERLVRRILDAIAMHQPAVVYAPSPLEIHPDHQAVALAAAEAVRRCSPPLVLAPYEVGAPLYPNRLLDISALVERKQAAIACFTSQLAVQDYHRHSLALNEFRTFTLAKSVRAAEAYRVVTTVDLAAGLNCLCVPEYWRARGPGSNAAPDRSPPVSIVVRSMARSTLAEALDSIALQTYPNIEAVLVNARGPDHPPPGEWCGRFPLRFVDRGKPLDRSAAANAGLAAARGRYIGFLDDDDLLLPDHVAVLIDALRDQDRAKVAYAGVRMIAYLPDGRIGSESLLDQPFHLPSLRAQNYIPMHAVLFDRVLLDLGCRFDENLALYEDWDFWLQLAEHGEFLHVDRITACYRNFGHSGFGLRPDEARIAAGRAALFAKWGRRWSGTEWAETLAALRDGVIHRQSGRADAEQPMVETLAGNLAEQTALLHQILARLEEQRQQTTALDEQVRRADGLAVAVQTLQTQIAESTRQLEELRRSTSWRVTGPLRWLSRAARRLGGKRS
ncbi:MAG: PIG-L family deacetylase [Candidatus Competibacter sp.]|nr:PIG-L family deacetylase [Candidatus Competibacter sp.]